MLNITYIEDTIADWIEGVTGGLVIIAKPSKERPKVQYTAINVIQNTQVGMYDQEGDLQPDDSVDMSYSNLEDVMVSINTYYDDVYTAYELATLIKDSLDRTTVHETLWGAGLGFSRVTDVQDIDEEIQKKFEKRGQFDCYFYTRSLDIENIETIKKIELTNNINNDGGTVIIETT